MDEQLHHTSDEASRLHRKLLAYLLTTLLLAGDVQLVYRVNEIELIAITITLSQQMSFNVIGVYRQPSSDVTFYEHFKNLLKKLDKKKE